MATSPDLRDMLLNYLGKSALTNKSNKSFAREGEQDDIWLYDPDASEVLMASRSFYAYFTPVIMVIGFIGNSLSLNVFLSKNMRRLSASVYLAVLSGSDLATLFFYVTVEWLRRGFTHICPDSRIEFLDANGVCQIQLYLSYVSRFLSAWIVVAFTIERCIGVCYPLHRRYFCTKTATRRCIITIIIMALTLSLYKPLLSGVYIHGNGDRYCASDPEYGFASFVIDNVFAVLIAVVPFIIITILNAKIVCTILMRNKRNKEREFVFERSAIKVELTFTLFAISVCFVLFNVPFFSVWFRNFFNSKYFSNENDIGDASNFDYWQGILYITRTLFYINYCINFFLYSITGTYFRREVKLLFSFRPLESSGMPTKVTSMNTIQTWV